MGRPERGDAEGKDRILEPVALREFQMGENAAADHLAPCHAIGGLPGFGSRSLPVARPAKDKAVPGNVDKAALHNVGVRFHRFGQQRLYGTFAQRVV